MRRRIQWSKNEFSHRLSPEPTWLGASVLRFGVQVHHVTVPTWLSFFRCAALHFMKNSIVILVSLLFLVGCDKHIAQKPSPLDITVLTNGQSPIIKIAFTNDPSLTNTGSHSTQPLLMRFKKGSDRDTVSRELDRIHATVLTNTPEFLLAEVQSPVRMAQVELHFADGKLTKVIYKP